VKKGFGSKGELPSRQADYIIMMIMIMMMMSGKDGMGLSMEYKPQQQLTFHPRITL